MGCESSRTAKNNITVVKKTTKEELRRHGQLTEFEKDVIHSTWPLLSSQMCEHGCAVLFSAIQMSPGLRGYFIYGDLSDQSIFMNPEFRKHGLDYMKALSDVVEHIDNLGGDISDRLMVLGARHASIPNFKLDYLKIFVRATLNTWEGILGEEYTEEVQHVWTILLDFVVKLMTEGCLIYDEEGSHSLSSNISLHSCDLGPLYAPENPHRGMARGIIIPRHQPNIKSKQNEAAAPEKNNLTKKLRSQSLETGRDAKRIQFANSAAETLLQDNATNPETPTSK